VSVIIQIVSHYDRERCDEPFHAQDFECRSLSQTDRIPGILFWSEIHDNFRRHSIAKLKHCSCKKDTNSKKKASPHLGHVPVIQGGGFPAPFAASREIDGDGISAPQTHAQTLPHVGW
jgi:hypothetical protein